MKYQLGKLSIRIVIFLSGLWCYIFNRESLNTAVFKEGHISFFVLAFWLCVVMTMVLRSFPSKYESRGSTKQFDFLCNAEISQANLKALKTQKRTADKQAFLVMAVWLLFNSIFFLLYGFKVIKNEFMVLLSAFYLMADTICIVFWCPFQHFIMKNRCCSTCRIFNWDTIMIVTPLVVLNTFFSWSLIVLSLVFWLRWEYVSHKHYQRFSEITNKNLSCSTCTEHLCRYKGKYTV